MFDPAGAVLFPAAVPVSPDGLLGAICERDLVEVRTALAIGEFDAAGLAEEHCGLGTESWLRQHARMDHKTAGRLVALGRRLHRFPFLRAAALDGRLSAGQLAIVTACVPERHFARFAEHEEVVVGELERLGIDGTRILLRSWLAKADALDEPEGRAEGANEAFLSRTLDGRGELRASLDADRTARADTALRLAESKDLDAPKPARRADALDTIFRFFLDHHEEPPGRRNRPHVNVVMTYEQFVGGLGGTYVESGGAVSRVDAEVLRCDAHLHRVLVDAEGAILDYGRQTRQWRRDVANAILLRDGGCRFDGCDRPPAWCQIHHTREWVADGGETSFRDGVMHCDAHHHLVHRHGLRLELLPDGTLETTWPDGRVVTTHPRGPISPHLWDEVQKRRPGGS